MNRHERSEAELRDGMASGIAGPEPPDGMTSGVLGPEPLDGMASGKPGPEPLDGMASGKPGPSHSTAWHPANPDLSRPMVWDPTFLPRHKWLRQARLEADRRECADPTVGQDRAQDGICRPPAP